MTSPWLGQWWQLYFFIFIELIFKLSIQFILVYDTSAPFTNIELLHALGIVLGIWNSNVDLDTTVDHQVFTS